MKRIVSIGMIMVMMVSFCLSMQPLTSYAASPWNILNDNLSAYVTTGWSTQNTDNTHNTIVQNADNVTIVDTTSFSAYLTKSNVLPATGPFTFEVRAK